MRPHAFALAAASLITATSGRACGLRGADIPVGTPIQELSITGHDRPTMGFGTQSSITSVSVSIVARPCHGMLTVTIPPGVRYAPDPGFSGTDMYAIRGCRELGRCGITGAIVTVRQ